MNYLRGWLALGLLSLPGCYSYRTTTASLPANQSVRVLYATPRDLPVMVGSDSMPIDGVRELIGRVRAQSGDTLWLNFSSARDTDRVVSTRPSDATAYVVRGPETTIQLRRMNKFKTAGAVLLGTAIGVVALVASQGSSGPQY